MDQQRATSGANEIATTSTAYPMMFTEQLINKICCDIINRLLAALRCFSPPITDLHQLHDGVALVELIECFEETMAINASDKSTAEPQQQFATDSISQPPRRAPLHRNETHSNMEYVERWLQIEGIKLDSSRSIRGMFAEIARSSLELAEFMSKYDDDDDGQDGARQDGPDRNGALLLLHKQRATIYARSIAYISALCYAIVTIFLKYAKHFERQIAGFRFSVQPDELLHIMFYTKWKLTEEELLLKDLERMRLQDAVDSLEIENRRLADICRHLGAKRDDSRLVSETARGANSTSSTFVVHHAADASAGSKIVNQHLDNNNNNNNYHQNQNNKPEMAENRRANSMTQKDDKISISSSSSISSIAEMRSVATTTDICGLDNELLIRFAFDRRQMALAGDRQKIEKIQQLQQQLQQLQQNKSSSQSPNNISSGSSSNIGHQASTPSPQPRQNIANHDNNNNNRNNDTNDDHSIIANNQFSFEIDAQNQRSKNDFEEIKSHSAAANQKSKIEMSEDSNLVEKQILRKPESKNSDEKSWFSKLGLENPGYDFVGIGNNPTFVRNRSLIEQALSGGNKRRSLPIVHEEDDEKSTDKSYQHSSSYPSSSSYQHHHPDYHQVRNKSEDHRRSHDNRNNSRLQQPAPKPNYQTLASSSTRGDDSNRELSIVVANAGLSENDVTADNDKKLNNSDRSSIDSVSITNLYRVDNVDDEQLRSRILIARLLAELSYEKNKSMKQHQHQHQQPQQQQQQLRQTNIEYI